MIWSEPGAEVLLMGLPIPLLTEDEYLKFERAATERHLYIDGEIFAMAGESPAHADITSNTIALIVNQLGDGPCRARVANTKVRSGPLPQSPKRLSGLFSYPDIVVICDEPRYLDEYQDVVLNPRAIFEALSESTEAFDRGEKFDRYQQFNPTLSDYVLISQDEPKIEHYHRKKNGKWTYECHRGLKAEVKLPSIKCRLKATDVYRRIKFKKRPGV
jgi:Uma2 family endonuclease